jgi:hypothetical protein
MSACRLQRPKSKPPFASAVAVMMKKNYGKFFSGKFTFADIQTSF